MLIYFWILLDINVDNTLIYDISNYTVRNEKYEKKNYSVLDTNLHFLVNFSTSFMWGPLKSLYQIIIQTYFPALPHAQGQ